MNKRTIEKILSKKINEWIASIDDPEVKLAAKKDTIVTGGSIASMLLNEKVNDFDIYFRTKQTTKLVAEYYAAKTNGIVKVVDGANYQNHETPKYYNDELKITEDSDDQFSVFIRDISPDRIKIFVKGTNYYNVNNDEANLLEEDSDQQIINSIFTKEKSDKEILPYSPRVFTCNAITLTDQIQLVIRFYGEPEELHKNYDFVHATNYYDHSTGKLTLRHEALESLLTKELRYIGSLYPVTSIIRTKKFIKRGWNINAGTYLKIMFQVSQLDLTDVKILEEQLLGIDIAWFSILLEAISNVDKDKLDYNYISEIIDRIFN